MSVKEDLPYSEEAKLLKNDLDGLNDVYKDIADMSLLADYAEYMRKYADFVEEFEKWETDEKMNTAETAYYIDVQARVSKSLLEVAN